jgi:hypothetical protein
MYVYTLMPSALKCKTWTQVLELSQARGDLRQEARTQNCLGLMYSENGAQEKAIPALQSAIACCREGLQKAREKERAKESDEDAAAEVEFWATGLIVCIANLGCVLTRSGHLQVSGIRLRACTRIV